MTDIPMERATDGIHKYRAVIEFAVRYRLPDGVHETAVIRALREPTLIAVTSLEAVGSDDLTRTRICDRCSAKEQNHHNDDEQQD